MHFSNFKAKQMAVTSMRALFGLLMVASISAPSIIHAQTGQATPPPTFDDLFTAPPRAPSSAEHGAEARAVAGSGQAYQNAEAQDVIADAAVCESYGFAKGTSDFGNCMLQLRRERIALQIEQIRYLQQAIAATEARTQALIAAEAQARREAQAEKEAGRRRSAEKAERLMQLSEDMLCPKQGPGAFAPPVAGCGSNRNAVRPSTTNVIVNIERKDCEYRTAAGCR